MADLRDSLERAASKAGELAYWLRRAEEESGREPLLGEAAATAEGLEDAVAKYLETVP